MSPFSTRQLEQVRELCREFAVERLDVFGSAANGSFKPGQSDFDFVVRFAPCSPSEHYDRYFGLLESLERLCGVKVDLLEESAFRNPYFIRRVNESRVELYAA